MDNKCLTLTDIEGLDKEFLTAAEVAPVMGMDAQYLRSQAQSDRTKLGFPVIVIGSRVRIPKEGFLFFCRYGQMGSTCNFEDGNLPAKFIGQRGERDDKKGYQPRREGVVQITIEGTPKEIAALVLELREQQEEVLVSNLDPDEKRVPYEQSGRASRGV